MFRFPAPPVPSRLDLRDVSLNATSNPKVRSLLTESYRLSRVQKNHTQAEIILTQAINLEPACADAFRRRGLARCRMGRIGTKIWDLGIRDFDKALFLRPDFDRAMMNKGIVFSENGEYDKAEEFLHAAIQMNPRSSMAFFNRGRNCRRRNDHQGALRAFTRSVEVNPDYYPSFQGRGNVYWILGNSELALRDYERALQIYPGVWNSSLSQVAALLNLQRYQQALVAADETVGYYPQCARAACRRMAAYVGLKRYEDAYYEFQRAMELDSTEAQLDSVQYSRLKILLKGVTLRWLSRWFEEVDGLCCLLLRSQVESFPRIGLLRCYQKRFNDIRKESVEAMLDLKKKLLSTEGTSLRNDLDDYFNACSSGQALIELRRPSSLVQFVRGHSGADEWVVAILVEEISLNCGLRTLAEETLKRFSTATSQIHFLRVDVHSEAGLQVLLHFDVVLCPVLLVFHERQLVREMTLEGVCVEDVGRVVAKLQESFGKEGI